MTKWGESVTCKFVEEYRFHECLWNFKSPRYKNRDTRMSAYEAIISAMGLPGLTVLEVKNKIKNLRSTYSQEVKKIKASQKGGSATDSVYRSTLKWFDNMEAIVSCSAASMESQYKKPQDSMEVEEEADEELDCQDSPHEQDAPWYPEPTMPQGVPQQRDAPLKHELSQQEKPCQQNLTPQLAPRRRKKQLQMRTLRKPNMEDALMMALETISRERDCHQVFGDYVASSLRNMRHLAIRKRLRLTIQKAILDASLLDDRNGGPCNLDPRECVTPVFRQTEIDPS